MNQLKDLIIKPDKKYLVISKATTFLEKTKLIMEAKLNISDVYDTKSHKNSMAFETIILSKGGFIKFFLYNSNNLIKCDYDVVIVDSTLYASDYSYIRSKCLLASMIVVTESDNVPEDFSQAIEVYGSDKVKVKKRLFSYKNFSDYGECPKCGTIVYSYDKHCPICDVELDWDLSKDDIINLCVEYGEFNDSIGENLMHCNENFYNRYYCLLHTFGVERLRMMDEAELRDLLKLADEITTGLY